MAFARAGFAFGADQCADCSATTNVIWACLNRGVLVCDECCSVHRTFGRHVSHIKSLKRGSWHPDRLMLIHTLYRNGSNNIWEHALQDAKLKAKRKPSSTDVLFPTKADFIRSKYCNLAFCLRPPKENRSAFLADLNTQLFSCCRTSHVETAFRLLALGASPAYFDDEKGLTCLHVAAREGQNLQVELLCLFGADPLAPDFANKTPVDYARAADHADLANRLIELQYEVTDSATYYLCGRIPDHRSGQHYLIPELSWANLESSGTEIKTAKKQLSNLSDFSFEKLAVDIFDEVDRRETDAAWLSAQGQKVPSSQRYVTPFLPVNPNFPATRNQSRQKVQMARLSTTEFASLVIDLLLECKRRTVGISASSASAAILGSSRTVQRGGYQNCRSLDEKFCSNLSVTSSAVDRWKSRTLISNGNDSTTKSSSDIDRAESPVYDDVPVDDIANESPSRNGIMSESMTQPAAADDYCDTRNKLRSPEMRNGTPATSGTNEDRQSVMLLRVEVADVKQQLAVSDARIANLETTCSDILSQMESMRSEIGRLAEMKHEIAVLSKGMDLLLSGADKRSSKSSTEDDHRKTTTNSRSFPTWTNNVGVTDRSSYEKLDANGNGHALFDSDSISNNGGITYNSNFVDEHEYESVVQIAPAAAKASIASSNSVASSNLSNAPHFERPQNNCDTTANQNSDFPENVVQQTDVLTKEIQTLLVGAQAGVVNNFCRDAICIQLAVDKLVELVPVSLRHANAALNAAANDIAEASLRLSVHCSAVPAMLKTDVASPAPAAKTSEGEPVSAFIFETVQISFDIARAAKRILTLGREYENNQ